MGNLPDVEKIARWDVPQESHPMALPEKDPYGDWCREGDVAKLEAELKAAKEMLEGLREQLRLANEDYSLTRAENARLRKALAFYADVGNYRCHVRVPEPEFGALHPPQHTLEGQVIFVDMGERARNALEESDE